MTNRFGFDGHKRRRYKKYQLPTLLHSSITKQIGIEEEKMSEDAGLLIASNHQHKSTSPEQSRKSNDNCCYMNQSVLRTYSEALLTMNPLPTPTATTSYHNHSNINSATIHKKWFFLERNRRRRRRRYIMGRNCAPNLSIPQATFTLLLCFVAVWVVLMKMMITYNHSITYQSIPEISLFSNRVRMMHPPFTHHQWDNPHQLVHVVQTRFMQHQPHLLILGEARLKLLEAITIPSMKSQSVQQYLWIIRTDPDLASALKRRLIHLIAQIPNAILVGSNDNPEGFRDSICIADIISETIWTGNMALLRSYHEAAANHTVLETRLDADDALATDFVEIIQLSAQEELQQHWRVWCAEHHIEWQYDSPWQNETNRNNVGALLGVKSGKCITPGLTWGYTIDAHRSDIHVSKHHEIQKKIPFCQDTSNSNLIPDTKCLVKMGGDLPLALRARTPTSAGMDHILVTHYTEHIFPLRHLQTSKWKDSQMVMWDSLPILFGINGMELWKIRAWIESNLVEIAKDALEGQCTKGHSCKKESKALLEKLAMEKS